MGRAWECLGPAHEHPIHSFEILLDTNTLKFNKQTHCTLILTSQKFNFDQTNAQIKANKVINQTSKIANFTLDLPFRLGKMVGQQGEAKPSCGFSRTVHCAPQIGGSIRCLRDPDISLVLEQQVRANCHKYPWPIKCVWILYVRGTCLRQTPTYCNWPSPVTDLREMRIQWDLIWCR